MYRNENLKIILLTLSLEHGGSEQRAITLARYFQKKEFNVELWGLNGPGSLSQMCDEFGIPWRVVPLDWYQKPRRRIANLFKWLIALRKAKPDILLPHTLIPNTVCGILWRWTGASRCIGYEGGYEFGLAGRHWESMAVRLTPVFICNAQHIASEMVNYYKCRENKIKIVPNGIELANPIHSRSWWRTSLGVGENAFLAVMVANLSGFKDHDTLLKAWRLVINRLAIKGVDAKLLLAGKDLGTESMLRRLVDKLGMREGVKILGKVQDVSGLLRSVDLGVYSSRREGSPNGIIECMLAGLAVAATDCDGIRWVLGEHQTPWLSRSDDIEQFAKNILSLKDDMNTRILIGMQNKDRAVKEFSPDKMCRTTELLVVG